MDRFAAYIPRWLRWGLLIVLGGLVLGFSVTFFVSVNHPDFRNWSSAAVSVVQIALTAFAYVLVVFFTESSQSPRVLQRKARHIQTVLMPEVFARITDDDGAPVEVSVGAPSGVVGYDYTLRSANAALRMWVGLNVHRVIVIVFCARPDGVDDDVFMEDLKKIFHDTTKGAQAIGYDEPHYQRAEKNGRRFVSVWQTWDIRKGGTGEDFLTHYTSQLFFAQDVALMAQSFLRTGQRHGITMTTPFAPHPL
jgi:hypothetical protein